MSNRPKPEELQEIIASEPGHAGARSTPSLQGEIHDHKAGSDAISSHDCSSTERLDANHPHGADPSAVPLSGTPSLPAQDAPKLAQLFHETYERLAPQFGYETRRESAKPWAEVPENNRKLMTAVCAEILNHLGGSTPSPDPPQTDKVLEGLRYIADSPAHEHGGFHPEAVKTAKNAIAEIERLRAAAPDPKGE